MLKTKRAYEPAEPGDGVRFLVDRLGLRGIKKEALEMQAWLLTLLYSTRDTEHNSAVLLRTFLEEQIDG